MEVYLCLHYGTMADYRSMLEKQLDSFWPALGYTGAAHRDSITIDKIRVEVGDSKINAQSLIDLVKFLIMNSKLPGVLTSKGVFVLTLVYAQEYDKLPSNNAELR